MSAIFGMRGTGDWATPDERPKNYREKAFQLFPDSPNPFTAILSKLPSSSVDDPEFKIFEDRLPHMTWAVTGVIDAAEETIDLDEVLPRTDASPAKGLKKGDLLKNTRTGELMMINAEPVTDWDAVECTRGVGDVAAANTADHDVLEWAGSAYEEGSGAPEAVSLAPTVVTNYIQTFKDTCEMTGQAIETLIRPDRPWPREKKKCLERHMIQIERAFFHSAKDEISGAGGRKIRFTGGLDDLVDTCVTDFSATGVSMDGLEDAFETLFKYGSKSKIAFVGNKALTILNRVVRNNSQFYFMASQAIDKKQTFGLRVFNFVCPHGELGLIPHPLLNESATYNSWAYIVDPKYAEYVYFRNRDTKYTEKDLRQDLIDKVKGQYMTDAGLRLALEECHGTFKNMTAYTA